MHDLIDCDNETAIAGQTDLTDCSFWQKYPDAQLYQPSLEIAWKATLFVSVTLVSLLGNSLILWVLWLVPDARTSSTNVLIGNMALAHLPTCIVYCAVGLYKFSSGHNFLAGAFMCQYELVLKFTFLTATNLSLITMAGDRLKSFYWPNSRKITGRESVIACIVIWIFSTGFGYLFSSVRRLQVRDWSDFQEILCIDNSKRHYDLWLICLAVLVYIPIVTMVVLYSLIVRKLWQFEAKIADSLNASHQSFSRPVIQMIWVYLIVTIICYIPFQFLLIRREIVYPTNNESYTDWEIRWDFCRHLFFCIYTAINPFVFGFANKTFGSTIRQRFSRSSDQQQQALVRVID